MKLFFYFFTILGIVGCQGLQTRSISRPNLTLLLAEEIHVGKTTRADVLSRLGKPDRVIDLRQTDLKVREEIWAYFAGGIQSTGRITLFFPTSSDLVDSVSWDVRDGDPEQILTNALSRFKGRDLVRTRPKHWENPHSAPDEIFYEDSKTGLTIIYLQTPKRVTAISWALPDRTTTSDVDPILSAPYPYCIVGLCAGQPKK